MARNPRKRAAGDHNNNGNKRTRLNGGKTDHYSPSQRRRPSQSPRRHSPPPQSHHSPQEHKRRSTSSSPPRRHPSRSLAPRAIERSNEHTLAVRETSSARDIGQNLTRPIRELGEEGPETELEETTWEAVWETGVLSLEQQIPQLRSRGEPYQLDLHSPPQLLATVEPSIHSWRTAFLRGIFVYVDATTFQRLMGRYNVQPFRFLRQPEMTQIHDMVVRREGDHPELVDYKDLEGGNPRPPQWPSINTLSREAFTWYIGPYLSLGEKQLLDAYWAGLPRFNEDMPNTVPGHPELRATPTQLPNGDWDWTEMLQPIRWFMCPCALKKHECEFTGDHYMRCRGWQGICCNLTCRHGPSTTLIHVGTVCTYKWNGDLCPRDRECKFAHGIAVTAKGIEHRRYHHRIREL